MPNNYRKKLFYACGMTVQITLACVAADQAHFWSGLSQGQFATVSASSVQDDYVPELAVDGDYATRWGSAFGNHEWWQIEFREPQRIGGLKIFWEQAFAEKYGVEVSDDGKVWRQVYDVVAGDGQADLILFEPTDVRFLRINTSLRGTGWGNSIWEIQFLFDDQWPEVMASSNVDGYEPFRALDGRRFTGWRSAGDGEQHLTVNLPVALALGGVSLLWEDGAHARSYDVEISPDGVNWLAAASRNEGQGGYDYVFFPRRSARMIRIACRESARGAGYGLALIEFKDGDEASSPLREYKALARENDAGLYPMWLNRLQEFWTITGLPGEVHETLLSETGMIEPVKGAFGVQPFVQPEGGALAGWNAVAVEQSLEDGYLPVPSVTWRADGWSMRIEAVMSGQAGARFTAVRYRFINDGDRPFRGRLALAIRPVQLTPDWQHGGFSPITTGSFDRDTDETMRFNVNGRPQIVFMTGPEGAGATTLSGGGINRYLLQGQLPASQHASDANGKVEAGVFYALEVDPGEHSDVLVAFPLYQHARHSGVGEEISSSQDFDRLRDEHVVRWRSLLAMPRIEIPEMRIIDVMKSNLGYIMINRDGPFFKPGPRNYNHAWMRDGVLTGLATMRCGLYGMTRDFIHEFATHIREDGWVPWMILEDGRAVAFNSDPESGEGHEYDSQGQFPFIVREYVDFTGDEELARQVYPKVIKALKFARMLRERRMTEEYRSGALRAYFGILPLSNSHEGYYPARHSYWDNFWLIRGLKDALALADKLGHEDDAVWLRAELADVREAVYASIQTTIDEHAMDSLPGCVELADTDPTSTSIAIMIAGENNYLPQPYSTNSFEHYWAVLKARMQPGGEKLFTPYEVRNADVFIRLGWRDRALALFRDFIHGSTRPVAWNHMAEVVHDTWRTPAYIGDMPHTWVGADYVNAVRTIFVYEEDDRLVVAAGIDPAWANKRIVVHDLPTIFGSISYTITIRDGVVRISLSGSATPPDGFVIPVPDVWQSTPIELNGRVVSLTGGRILIANLSDEVLRSVSSKGDD